MQIRIIPLALLLAWALVAVGQTPATRPAATATRPAASRPAPDLSTPEKALAAYLDALQAEDAATVRRILHASTANGRKYADDMARFLTTNHRLHSAVARHFPKERFPFWEMATDQQIADTRAALPRIKATLKADTATLSIEGKQESPLLISGGMSMVRIANQWRISLDGIPTIDQYPRGDVSVAMMYLLARYSPAIDTVVADINAGKYKTVQEAQDALTKLTDPIQRKVEKELAEEPK